MVSKSPRVNTPGLQDREESDGEREPLRAAPPEVRSTAVRWMCSWNSHDVRYTVSHESFTAMLAKGFKKKNIHMACHSFPIVPSSFISEHDFSRSEAVLEVVNLNSLALD